MAVVKVRNLVGDAGKSRVPADATHVRPGHGVETEAKVPLPVRRVEGLSAHFVVPNTGAVEPEVTWKVYPRDHPMLAKEPRVGAVEPRTRPIPDLEVLRDYSGPSLDPNIEGTRRFLTRHGER